MMRFTAALAMVLLLSVSFGDAAENTSRAVSASGASVLQLKVEHGDVHLVADPSATAVRIGALDHAPQLEAFHVGDRVVITITGKGRSVVPFVESTATHYDLTYPARMHLELREFSGAVVIDEPRAPIAVDSSGGSITVRQAHAAIDLSDDAGDITATLAAGWHGDSIRMQTAGGTVRLAVPAHFRAHVDASSAHGTVHDDASINTASAPFVWLYTRNGDVFITTH